MPTPNDQLRATARSLGIDPNKYGQNDDLQGDVIAVRAGAAVPEGRGLDPVAPPPQDQPQQPPAQQPPPQQPHPANNQHGRAMNQAHAVVFGGPFTQDPYGNLAANQRSLDKTEAYIAKENDSRVQQEREEAERQHEREMEMLKQQGQQKSMSLVDRLGKEASGQGPLRMWDPSTMTWKYGNRVQVGKNGAQIY